MEENFWNFALHNLTVSIRFGWLIYAFVVSLVFFPLVFYFCLLHLSLSPSLGDSVILAKAASLTSTLIKSREPIIEDGFTFFSHLFLCR